MNQKRIPQKILDQIKNDPTVPDEFKPIRQWPEVRFMNDLSKISDSALKAELDRREKVAKTPPTLIENPDWSGVIKNAQAIVDSVLDGSYHEDNDDDHYIFEDVMATLYGPTFWDWFNKNTE